MPTLLPHSRKIFPLYYTHGTDSRATLCADSAVFLCSINLFDHSAFDKSKQLDCQEERDCSKTVIQFKYTAETAKIQTCLRSAGITAKGLVIAGLNA